MFLFVCLPVMRGVTELGLQALVARTMVCCRLCLCLRVDVVVRHVCVCFCVLVCLGCCLLFASCLVVLCGS